MVDGPVQTRLARIRVIAGIAAVVVLAVAGAMVATGHVDQVVKFVVIGTGITIGLAVAMLLVRRSLPPS